LIDRRPQIFSPLSARRPDWALSGGPSDAGATLRGVYFATLICSDEACAEELDLVVDDLGELGAAVCDCDCTLVVLSVSGWSAAELPVFA
jgi:hypothetical protein